MIVSSPEPNLANDCCGWASHIPAFKSASLEEVVSSLEAYVRDSTPEQINAWKKSVPHLQTECGKVAGTDPKALQYGAILEFQMPDGPHRVDAILLVSGAVLVLELKGDGNWQPEYTEQAADYARRLYWYHELCGQEDVRVHTILVSYGLKGDEVATEWHTRTNIENLLDVVRRFDRPHEANPISVERFIQPGLCQPSLSLVQAARRYFAEHELPHIKRIDEVTSATVERVVTQIRAAHQGKLRKLVLVSGVPGAGKTFVGLKIAHEAFLDELAVPMANGAKPNAPAVFLSGNGPLVDVLQYELKRAGGAGRVFVRGVKNFVKSYSKPRSPAPPHHVLIFDEAQRAWDQMRVRAKHADRDAVSEPETFVRFAEKIPEWSVVMGLIGEGQEIHIGEEGGMDLWAVAISKSTVPWQVVGPARFAKVFASRGVAYSAHDEMHLSQSVRFNFAAGLSKWAAELVEDGTNLSELAGQADLLKRQGYQLRVTRSLDRAREFLWEKYKSLPEARFGALVSSRDKEQKNLPLKAADGRFFRAGPWYADPESSPSSCRRLQDAITEFSAQGLELDHSLLIWGGDFIREGDCWSIAASKKYQRSGSVRDPLQLRRNAYRVLLTRGREGVVVCVPEGLSGGDTTYAHLIASGCEVLG